MNWKAVWFLFMVCFFTANLSRVMHDESGIEALFTLLMLVIACGGLVHAGRKQN